MRRLLVLLLALAALLAPTTVAAAQPTTQPTTQPAAQPAARATTPADRGPVLVVGIPGLRWADVGPATPALRRLLEGGAAGVLSVKAVPAVSCRADGWLTLGAGNRAVAPGVRRSPCGVDLPPDPRAVVAANEQEVQGAELGALAAALDGCVDVRGAGPELAVLGQGLRSDGGGCRLVLREAPPVSGTGTERVMSVVAADRVLAGLLGGSDPAHVLVVGLSAGPGEAAAVLHVAVAAGPAFPPGALTSASTRRAPYVQLVDVAPTVLGLLDVPAPASMTGQPWRSVGEPPPVGALADLALLAEVQKGATVPFFVVLLAAQLALLVLLWRRRPEVAELVALGSTAALGASYLAGLVPWWRSPAPLLTLLAVVVVLASAVAALAQRQGGRAPAGQSLQGCARAAHERRERALLRPVGTACAFTAAVLLTDLVTGAHLQISAVSGYSPLVAGRFAGIGNVAFGVLAASVLLATAALTRRATVVAAVGVVTVVVDGAPSWGSDVGGVLALVPAFVLLGLRLSGRRVSAVRLGAAFAVGVAVVTAFALLELRRGERERTHLGRFAQDLVDGTAGTLLRRKAEAVFGLLLSSPVTAALPLVVAAAVYLVLRPPPPLRAAFAAAPAWRAGLVATGLAGALGFAVNDSGAAVPALAVCVAVPATAAVVLRVRRMTVAQVGSVERAAARRGAARC